MSYSNILVAVAVTPESQQLLAKAVSIARPVKGHISLITLASDPEMYNQLAAPMLEDLRSVMQEETQSFLDKLIQDAGYPVDKTFIAVSYTHLDVYKRQVHIHLAELNS